ncbi:MAG: inositol monophosphatase family protein [archaeon]
MATSLAAAHSSAIRAAKAAGKVLLSKYRKAKILGEKGSASTYELVTTADLASEKEIFPILRKTGIPILSEETRADAEIPEKGLCFAVDPLDGTVNYSCKIPFFSVSIGILKDRVPVAGAMLNPATGELFSSLRGNGAFLNGKLISVSGNGLLSKTLINHCHRQGKEEIGKLSGVYEKLKLAGRDFRRLGAGTLDLAWVASGRNDCFFTIGFGGLWDVAAGVSLVREAGGRVTDFSGRDWTIDKPNLLATNNKEIQRQMLELIGALGD